MGAGASAGKLGVGQQKEANRDQVLQLSKSKYLVVLVGHSHQ